MSLKSVRIEARLCSAPNYKRQTKESFLNVLTLKKKKTTRPKFSLWSDSKVGFIQWKCFFKSQCHVDWTVLVMLFQIDFGMPYLCNTLPVEFLLACLPFSNGLRSCYLSCAVVIYVYNAHKSSRPVGIGTSLIIPL